MQPQDAGQLAMERLPELLKAGKLEAALAVLADADEGAPASLTTFRRGLLLKRLRRFDEALECLQRCGEAGVPPTQAREEAGECRIALVEWYEAIGDGYAAAAHRAALLRDSPEDARGWINLGLRVMWMGDTARAAAYFRRGLEIEPSNQAGLLNMALLLADGGRPQDAIEHLDRLLRIDPSDAEAWYHRGQCYLQLGGGPSSVVGLSEPRNIREARTSFQNALQIDPQLAPAATALSRLET